MRDGWQEVSLAEVCDKPMYGLIASASDEATGPHFIRQTDIVRGEVDWGTVPFCDASPADVEKYRVQVGDLLVSRLGAGVGTAAHVDETRGAVFAGYLVRFQPNSSVLHHRFAKYVLHSPSWTQHVEATRSGAAQPTLNAKQMGRFRFLLPPPEEQRRIAGVLGALDDLIDTNRALIANLLRQADSFARKMLREGELLTFAEVCDVYGGATPKTSIDDYWGGPHFWATPTDITALPSPYIFASARTITDAGLASCTTRLHPSGSILMTSRATIGAFALAEVPIAVNQGFIVVEPRETNDRYFLLHEMRRRVPEFLSRANGSTFKELSRGTFKTLEVDWPGAADRQRFADAVGPLHRAAADLEGEIRDLQRARDRLLPLLVSGQIRVAEAAELVGAIA